MEFGAKGTVQAHIHIKGAWLWSDEGLVINCLYYSAFRKYSDPLDFSPILLRYSLILKIQKKID